MTFSPICISKALNLTLNNTGMYIDNNYVVFVNIKNNTILFFEISIIVFVYSYMILVTVK